MVISHCLLMAVGANDELFKGRILTSFTIPSSEVIKNNYHVDQYEDRLKNGERLVLLDVAYVMPAKPRWEKIDKV